MRVVAIVVLIAGCLNLVGTGCGPCGCVRSRGEPVVGSPPPAPAPRDTTAATHVVVYYFHRTIRCETCLKFEALTEGALRGGFADELASGRLAWRVMDFEEPENEHLATTYDVFESSVVVSKLAGEREVEWKKLEDIWGLVEHEDAFIGYIQEEVGAYLGGEAHGE